MLKKILSLFFIGWIILGLNGCHSKEDPKQIRVGTITGPETQLMQVAKTVLLKQSDLHLKIITFSDHSLLNRALNDGNLDANMFQHKPFLDQELKYQHYHLVPLAKLFIYPMGIYSKKIDSLASLKQNAIIAIPNDPSNEARSLLLLQQAGLIKLNPKAKNLVTLHDIISNPKHLKIEELEAAQLTRALPDVDAAVINTNYSIQANLYPDKNALFSENKNSQYANLLVVKTKDKNNPKLLALVKALHSPEVLAAAKKLFHNQAIPAWQ